MDIKKNLNIASNSKQASKALGLLQSLMNYCGDYFSGRKHRIRPAIKRQIGKFESFLQYVEDYFSGNKYGFKKSCEKQK